MSLVLGSIVRELGLKVSSGRKIYPRGIGGHFCAYVHRVVLKIGEEEVTCDVAFSGELPLGINILGRKGVFEKFVVTFDEGEKKVKLETASS